MYAYGLASSACWTHVTLFSAYTIVTSLCPSPCGSYRLSVKEAPSQSSILVVLALMPEAATTMPVILTNSGTYAFSRSLADVGVASQMMVTWMSSASVSPFPLGKLTSSTASLAASSNQGIISQGDSLSLSASCSSYPAKSRVLISSLYSFLR